MDAYENEQTKVIAIRAGVLGDLIRAELRTGVEALRQQAMSDGRVDMFRVESTVNDVYYRMVARYTMPEYDAPDVEAIADGELKALRAVLAQKETRIKALEAKLDIACKTVEDWLSSFSDVMNNYGGSHAEKRGAIQGLVYLYRQKTSRLFNRYYPEAAADSDIPF